MITSEFVLMLNERNLCTWYILPLIGLNPAYFIDANFINSYMVKGKMQIAVEVADTYFCVQVESLPVYDRTVEHESTGRMFIVFNIHPDWYDDVQLFSKGQYSKFSEEAKTCIIQNSGLNYKLESDGHTYTSSIILALDKSPKLKETWAKELGVDIDHLPEELLSIPAESCYIEL